MVPKKIRIFFLTFFRHHDRPKKTLDTRARPMIGGSRLHVGTTGKDRPDRTTKKIDIGHTIYVARDRTCVILVLFDSVGSESSAVDASYH
jgi:hypothetical protein